MCQIHLILIRFTVSICNAQTPNQINDQHENYLNEWNQGTDESEGGASKYVEPFWHYFNGDFLECSPFGITSMVSSWNDQYFYGFLRVWNIYQLNLEMEKKITL